MESENLERLEGWELRLSAFIKTRLNIPFEWGTNDCCMFPADCVYNLTGFDPAERWRGQYDTEEQANTLASEYGGVEGIITQGIGFQPTDNWRLAMRGDVVLIDLPTGKTGGIIDDTGRYCLATSPNGILRLPLNRAEKVWSY